MVYTQAAPVELDPTVASQTKIIGRIQLLSSQTSVQLAQRPILEVAAPAKPNTAKFTDGLGAYGAFDRVAGFDVDGSPCVYFQFSDSAALSGTMLKSQGGLPVPSLVSAPGASSALVRTMKVLNTVMGPGRAFTRAAVQANLATAQAKSVAAVPLLHANAMQPEDDPVDDLMGGILDCFLIDSGTDYVDGDAVITLPGQNPTPAIGAFVFFSAGTGSPIQVAGQMLQRTQAPDGSYLLCSDLNADVINGGVVMGIDPDYGATDYASSQDLGPGGVFGTYYQMTQLDFVVPPTLMGDQQPPYGQLSFATMAASGAFQPATMVATTDNAFVCIQAHDNQTSWQNLVLAVQVDGNPMPQCSGSCGTSQNWTLGPLVSVAANGMATYRFPLGSLAEGSHNVQAVLFDQACNRTALNGTLAVVAMGAGNCQPGPGAPVASLAIAGGTAAANLSAMIHVLFTEPVTGFSTSSLFLEHVDPGSGAWVADQVQLMGANGAVLPTNSLCEVVLVPLVPLMAGTSYRVRWSGVIQDGKQLSPMGGPLGFTTAAYVPYPVLPITVDRVADVAAMANMVYVGGTASAMGTWGDTIQYWTYDSGTWNPQGLIGPGQDGGFYGQQISRTRAFPQVNVGNGQFLNLLLVTTTPAPGDESHQAVLWGFQACGAPNLLFAVSLGAGACGYCPSVDCQNGIIAAGRLTGSVALIDVPTAISGWQACLQAGEDPSLAVAPAGMNQAAIIQPFYLMDPNASAVPANWGVGLIPNPNGADTLQIDVAVGFLNAPLCGMPNEILSSPSGVWIPQPPFQGPAGGVDSRAVACPLSGGGVTRLAVMPNVALVDGSGNSLGTKNLGIGLTGSSRLTIVDESNPASPVEMAHWDAPGTILYRMPAVDDTYPYLAIPVQTTFGLVWYVITVQVQGIPQVLATLPSQGNFGTMSDGVLFNASNSALSATDLSIPTGVQPDSITSEIRNFYVNPLRLSVFSPPTKMKPTCSSSCPGVDALMATMQSNNYSFDAVCIAYTAFLEALGQNAATKYAIADVIFNRKAAIPTQRQPVQSWPRTYVGIVTQGGQFDVYAVRPARKIAVQSQNNLNATIFQIKTELANVGCSGILNYLQMYTDVLDYVTNRLSGSGPQGILDSRVTWFYSPCGYQGPVNPIVGCPAGYSSPSGILNFYEQNGNGIQGGPCGQNLFRFFYQDFCYIWQRPLTGGFPKISASMIQGLCTQGPITTPYVVLIVVNGFAMSISGNGRTGIFSGQIPSLVPNSKNTFLMTVITNSGRVLSETRSNITVTN